MTDIPGLDTFLWMLLMGAIGGIINGFLNTKGFVLPKIVDGAFQPGFIGSIVLGAAAAGLSYILYGPLANATAINPPPPAPGAPTPTYTLSWSQLAGSVLIGIGGAKWLTDQADKHLQKLANVEFLRKFNAERMARIGGVEFSAAQPPTPPSVTPEQVRKATPAEVLQIARNL